MKEKIGEVEAVIVFRISAFLLVDIKFFPKKICSYIRFGKSSPFVETMKYWGKKIYQKYPKLFSIVFLGDRVNLS